MALRQKTTVLPGREGSTTVGPNIEIRGRVEGEEDLRVEGRVEGSIELSETLFVADGGVVAAEVRARDVVVSGVVLGDVTATNSVTLHAGAKLVGDIHAPRLVIADGAAFKGKIDMGGEVAAPRERPRPVASARPVATAQGRTASRRTASAIATAPASRGGSHGGDEVTVVVRHSDLGSDGQRAGSRGVPAAERTQPVERKRAVGPKLPPRGRRRVAQR